MKLSRRFETIVGLALFLAVVVVSNATAQVVISNETLVTTTFVVNKQIATARCTTNGCRADRFMFAAIPVTCPAATGQTCTFHISLDTKTSISATFPGGGQGPTGFYQFLIDGIAPTIGPTDKSGTYVFERNNYTNDDSSTRLSYPASVLTTVTNSGSNSHTIVVNVGCSDVLGEGGCQATSYWSTMRVDVFEP